MIQFERKIQYKVLKLLMATSTKRHDAHNNIFINIEIDIL